MFLPLAKATAVMVWVPGVDGAVNMHENTETPTLAKLVKRCPGVCGGANGPALVTSCANDVAVEPLTGTSKVVPITEPSSWDHNKSLVSAAPCKECCSLQCSIRRKGSRSRQMGRLPPRG